MIRIKRVYDSPEPDDGIRFLVDRLWPRGFKKDDLIAEAWVKNAAPSSELRKWFGHDPDRWDEFCRRYFAELEENPDAWQPMLAAARKGTVTLLYAARDTEHNDAVALKRYLEEKLA